ncbi:MAG: hypothetical protein PHT07_15055 [Paludibacter sp.]|nr:hypothetical protein [Paludibacter sp.]
MIELIIGVIGEGMIAPDSEFGIKLGFTSDKFDGYLWDSKEYITISFIESIDPNKGNLKRLFDRIEELGYGIFVPTPFERMRSICVKRGMEWKGITLDGVYVEGYFQPKK